MLQDPKHPLTPGYITDEAHQCITRDVSKTDIYSITFFWGVPWVSLPFGLFAQGHSPLAHHVSCLSVLAIKEIKKILWGLRLEASSRILLIFLGMLIALLFTSSRPSSNVEKL